MIRNISRSLTDLLGASYMEAVKNSAVELLGMDRAVADALAEEKVDFFRSASLPEDCCHLTWRQLERDSRRRDVARH